MTLRRTLEDRFWEKVDRRGPTDCWLWTATTSPPGYGGINLGGWDGKMAYAHRVSWELHFGPIPDGLCVCHRCDVPRCVNPSHLFLGTHSDNSRDAVRKGRWSQKGQSGEDASRAKLTWETVREIRHRFSREGIRQSQLAREYGVTDGAISAILHNETWRDTQ